MEQKAGTSALKPVLGFRDLVLFYLVAIFGVRLIPNAASAGPSIILIIILVLIIYFIPLALAVSSLSMRYPEEGGIYVWTKTAFGDFHGYVAAWTYWTSNLAFFPKYAFVWLQSAGIYYSRTWFSCPKPAIPGNYLNYTDILSSCIKYQRTESCNKIK